MSKLDEILNEKLPMLKQALREANYSATDISELLRLFSGLLVLMSFTLDNKADFDRRKINKVLSRHLGSGHSWYSSLKFLTGERALTIYSKRTDVIRELGGSKLIHAFNVLLPAARAELDLL